MPGPAVYVFVAVGVVAAAITFKELVYEPHIAPKVEAWAESFVENRRRNRARRNGPIAVSQSSEHTDENSGRTDHRKGDVADNDRTSVELQDLVAREVDEWRFGRHHDSTIRNRRVPTVIDEFNVDIPYNPLTPSQVIFDASASETVQPGPPSASISPRNLQSGTEMQQLPSVNSPVLQSPGLLIATSNISPSSTRATSPAESRHSHSSMSSFAPAVIGPSSFESVYGSPRSHATETLSDTARSRTHDFLDSNSRVTSPFSDFHSVHAAESNHSALTSPLVLSPRADSDFDFSDTSDGMLSPSLRSGMFSPSFDNEDPFEVGSVHESESSWASTGRRSPGP